MSNFKEIHIWDLPTSHIYIKFNRDFRENFFKLAREKFGNFNLVGKFLNVKRPDTTVAKNWRYGTNCCPLDLMIKLANQIGILVQDLEKNIEEIRYKTNIGKRGGSSGKPVKNPKLPVVLNEDFAEILGHICGDGTISRSNPRKGIDLKYVNSEPALIDSFQDLVRNVFGDIEPNIIRRNGIGYTRENYVLQYPSIVSLFILNVFDYKTDIDMELPSFISNTNLSAKARFLRAFFDDESCVQVKSKKILFGLKPVKPVLDVIKLLNEFNIRTGSIHKSTNGIYNKFEIGDQYSILKFKMFIGFKHPEKMKKLDKIIEIGWKFERFVNYIAKDKIIELIKNNGELEVSQISNILKRDKGTIQEHLENLRKEGKLESRKVQRRINNTNTFPNVWGVIGAEND